MILPITKFLYFFFGGEPLVRPDLLQLISHARNNGIRCVISTNGTMINADMAANLGKPAFLM
jgi:MoaA/NifB/PqqE/SkfB family radical SAM enzyme